MKFRTRCKSVIAAVTLLALGSVSATERPLPPTWWALANSFNSEDLGLVKSLRAMKWFEACSAWGAGVRSNRQTRRQAALQLMLEADGLINKLDLQHVPNRTIEIGMNTCGVIGAIGLPDSNNTTTTASLTRAQMVYRDRNLYVYTDAKQNSGNGIVTAIQR